MKKLIGKSKINISVFISGRGTNLKNLIKFAKKKKSFTFINLVVSNNRKAYGLKFAKKNKIETLIINFEKKNETNILLKK